MKEDDMMSTDDPPTQTLTVFELEERAAHYLK